MGGSKAKKTTQSNTSSANSTSSIAPPDYISQAYQSLVPQAQDLAAQPFQPYGGPLTSGLSTQQQQARVMTGDAVGAALPYFQQARDYIGQGAEAISPTAFSGDALQQYLNPFQQQVIDATLANTAENDRRQQGDLTGKAIMSGAWGGDRAGVAKAELARQQKLAGDTTFANLNMQNFNQALQTFQQQQGVQLGADQNNAARAGAAGQAMQGLGSSVQDSRLKDIAAMFQSGGVEQQADQSRISADYDQFQQQQAYPFMAQGWLANLLTGIGAGAGSTSEGTNSGQSYGTGTSKDGGSGIGSLVGTALTAGATLFSDERLKENIEPIGKSFDGQMIYRYNYKGDPATQIGLIAQEVEREHPDAVGQSGGYRTVDYRAATDDAAGVAGMRPAGDFASGGVVPYMHVNSRIPTMNPITGRTGLMPAPAPPPLPQVQSQSGGGSDGGGQSSTSGKDLGNALKGSGIFGGGASGSTGSFDANTPRFDFGSGAQLFGPGFKAGGVVDMEPDSHGVFRPAYAEGGVLVAENEDDAARLERETGMVTDAPRAPAFFGRDTAYAESKPIVPVSGLAGVDPDLAARVNGMVTNSGGVLPGVRSGFRSSDEQAALRARYLRGEGPVAAPPGSSKHEDGRAVDVALAGRPGTSQRANAVSHIDTVAPAWGLRQTVSSEPWHTEIDPQWQGPIQGRNSFPSSDDDAPEAVSAQARSPARGVAAASAPRATAYAPEGGVATDAFAGVKGSGDALTDTSSTGGDGVAARKAPADPNKGLGLGYLPKDVQMALIATGLGMMASRARTGGQQIGEGGLAGLQYYMQAQAGKKKEADDERDRNRKTTLEDRDFGLRERGTVNTEKTLAQQAQDRMEQRKFQERQQAEIERANKERESKESFKPIAGTGKDETGADVPGTYVFNSGTGDIVFKPGAVTGAKPKDPEADLQRKAEFERLKELNEQAEGARTIKAGASNLRELRKGVGYSGLPLAGAISKGAGMVGYGGGQALEAAATDFKLELSKKLKGAISDKEQAMLSSATPGLGMSDSGAEQTLATIEGAAARSIERNKFYQMWRARNKTLAGADDAWDTYVERNPVISTGKNGELMLNQKNLGNWQRYVGVVGKDGNVAPGPGMQEQVTAPAQPSPSGDVVTAKTPAEASALKPGTRYRTPDGKEFVR